MNNIYNNLLNKYYHPDGEKFVGSTKAGARVYIGSETPLKYISAIRSGHKSKDQIIKSFNKPSSPYKLTPLHLAVIKGRYEVAKGLLEAASANPNAKDWHGWTPLHHAAVIGNAKMINLLLKHGSDCSIANRRNGTPLNIHEMATAKTREISEPIYQINDDGKFDTITAKEFKKVTGAQYVDKMVVDRKIFVSDWADGSTQPPRPKCYNDLVEKYRQLEPKVALQPNAKDETGKPIPIGAGVVAKQGIKKGEIICEYLGEQIRSIPPDPNYYLPPVDGREYRNHAPMVNDSFPNAAGMELTNVDGLPLRKVLVAISDIQEGELVTYDYITHSVKFGLNPANDDMTEEEIINCRHIELRPRSLDNFANQVDLTLLFKKLVAYRDYSYDMPFYDDIEKLRYLFTTPSAYIKYTLEGKISIEQLDQFKKFITSDNSIYFRKELIHTIMQAPQEYTLLRKIIIFFLDKGYYQLVANLLNNMSEDRLLRWKKKELKPEDFKPILTTFGERLEKGHAKSCFDVIIDI